eukprot:NODE_596_length_1937_cov_7.022775_g477_i0.p1 GENE.NODE_596_length_1937_cov_7.022775_g477_i0~~NODE_596_length_1937_cov_7.022775_g477_i0.p1  ORF type:complete len:315 (+),score=61.73 NODE_596_length_1937_cov_7.022775_g477_i0:340-1284(+)
MQEPRDNTVDKVVQNLRGRFGIYVAPGARSGLAGLLRRYEEDRTFPQHSFSGSPGPVVGLSQAAAGQMDLPGFLRDCGVQLTADPFLQALGFPPRQSHKGLFGAAGHSCTSNALAALVLFAEGHLPSVPEILVLGQYIHLASRSFRGSSYADPQDLLPVVAPWFEMQEVGRPDVPPVAPGAWATVSFGSEPLASLALQTRPFLLFVQAADYTFATAGRAGHDFLVVETHTKPGRYPLSPGNTHIYQLSKLSDVASVASTLARAFLPGGSNSVVLTRLIPARQSSLGSFTRLAEIVNNLILRLSSKSLEGIVRNF